MRISIILYTALALFIAACNTSSTDGSSPELDSLKAENERLKAEAMTKDQSIDEFLQSLNEIEENLNAIKEREKIVRITSTSMENQNTKQEQIAADINMIGQLLLENKNKIASLNKKLKAAGIKSAELEKIIEGLNKKLDEKDNEIAALKEELTIANAALEKLFVEYNQRLEELDDKTGKLNTAYYVIGTKKELLEKGVITKEGGFVGIGKTNKLKSDFNKEYFTKIDVTTTSSIPLLTKKATVITTHPSGSYKIEGSKDKAEKLVISNSDEFWSASKYLVIIVE
jgi:septal ring factor EnvC (AmiA/AmiB activator)